MSNDPISLSTPGITGFARNISRPLKEHDGAPLHLSLLNMLARAAGFRNYQHLKAAESVRRRLEAHATHANVDHRLVERILHHLDRSGRLVRWPSRRSVQEEHFSWALWADLSAETMLHESEVNAVLKAVHLFGDAAILRRSLVGTGLVPRNPDGSNYQRLEQRHPAEVFGIIKKLKERGHPKKADDRSAQA